LTAPPWVLALVYWLHLLATIIWIGGLAALSIFIIPVARRSLDPQAYGSFFIHLQRRLDPLGWFCILLLTGTGLIQMSINPNYQGILTIENRWSLAIFAKHLVVLLMVGGSAIMTWGLMPRLQRSALQKKLAENVEFEKDESGLDDERIGRQENLLLRLNLVLGVLVLALTVIAQVG
jgi:uncharacterized membrane protein